MASIILWEWKKEPVSPQTSEESWLPEDADGLYVPDEDEVVKTEEEESEEETECKAEVAAKLLEGLDQLQDLDEWIKAESFPSNIWVEEKSLAIFEDVERTFCSANFALKVEEVKPCLVPDTQILLKEFETIYDAVELTHGTLTPPQSPTYEPLLATLEPAVPAYSEKTLLAPFNPSSILQLSSNYAPQTPQPDVAHELAVVDELIRSRAEDLIQGPYSPESSSNSSNGEDEHEHEQSSSSDPEWMPTDVDAPTTDYQNVLKTTFRKRSKPYARNGVEDKKSRKKEQNKNAATRYRMKKKAEIEEILDEERGLSTENNQLEVKIDDLHREIKYLKGLMRELFRAKGLLN